MTPTREEVIRVARECGITFAPMVVDGVEYQFRHVRFHDPNCDSDEADCIERLANHFYEAGAAASREPLVADKRMKVKLGGAYGHELEGHWFYLHPADGFAEKALEQRTGIAKVTGEQI